MRISSVSAIIFSFVVGIYLSSCTDGSLQTSEWNPDFAVALVNSEFTLTDVIEALDEDGIILVDSGDLVHLVYSGRVLSVQGSELVTIPELTFPVLDETNGVIPSNFPDIGLIRQVDLSAGKMILDLETSENRQANIQIQFPSLTKDGEVLTLDTSLVINGPLIMEANLAGYTMSSGNSDFGYTMTYDGIPDLSGSLTLTQLEFSYIQGRFDPVLTQTPLDTIEIELFKSQAAGTLRFQDYALSIFIRNSIGIPFEGKFNELTAKTNRNGEMEVIVDSLTSGLAFAYPRLSEVGQSKTTVFTANADNSNLGDVLQEGPTEIRHQIDGQTLPMLSDGFITDTSRFAIEFDVDLPLHLRAEQVLLKETFEFGLTELKEFDYMEDASLRIQTENGFPVELSMQLYFINSQGTVVDSLYENFQQVLQAAEVNAEGRVIAPEIVNFDIDIPEEKRIRISDATDVAIEFKTQSLNDGQTIVKIFDDYTFALRVGWRATLNP